MLRTLLAVVVLAVTTITLHAEDCGSRLIGGTSTSGKYRVKFDQSGKFQWQERTAHETFATRHTGRLLPGKGCSHLVTFVPDDGQSFVVVEQNMSGEGGDPAGKTYRIELPTGRPLDGPALGRMVAGFLAARKTVVAAKEVAKRIAGLDAHLASLER